MNPEKRQRVDSQRAIGKEIRQKYSKRVIGVATSILDGIDKLHKLDQEMIDEAQDAHDKKFDNKNTANIDVLHVSYDIDGENDGITYDDAGVLFSGIVDFAKEHLQQPIPIDLSATSVEEPKPVAAATTADATTPTSREIELHTTTPSMDTIVALEKKAQEADAYAQELNVARDEHMNGNQELRDYKPCMDALKKLVEYPRLSGYTVKPSKIELLVKEAHDKIEAEYKHDWEVYDSEQTSKREKVTKALAAARDAHVKAYCASKRACH